MSILKKVLSFEGEVGVRNPGPVLIEYDDDIVQKYHEGVTLADFSGRRVQWNTATAGAWGAVKGFVAGGVSAAKSGALQSTAEEMVNTFNKERNAPGIKLLQIAAEVNGVVPPEIQCVFAKTTEQLSSLKLDKVHELMTKLGVAQRWQVHDGVLGAASIAQVNPVTKLEGDGAAYVVKFRYPGLTTDSVRHNAEQAITAFAALSRMTEQTGGKKMPKLTNILRPFAKEVVHEINLRREVENIITFDRKRRALDTALPVVIPQVEEYSQLHIVMGSINGTSL